MNEISEINRERGVKPANKWTPFRGPSGPAGGGVLEALTVREGFTGAETPASPDNPQVFRFFEPGVTRLGNISRDATSI